MGRLAADLSSFLDATGSYVGLDIIPDGIKWCSENIVGRHGNVHFLLSDVRNGEYNPKGKIEAAEFRFPFDEESFDLVVLDSVFTHMLPPDLEHYLGEITRVLKPGGRCYATYFLLTEESREMMLTRDSTTSFKQHFGSYSVASAKVPELVVGYDEKFIEEMYARHGLTNERYPGFWCGQPSRWSPNSGTGMQDVVIAMKPKTSSALHQVAVGKEHH
jgi:SAM-dependent methyltransferase